MDNKKLVGVCIVNKNYNYGSILQSYATLMKLEEMGVNYEIIDYNHPQNIKFYLKAINRFRSKDMVYSKIRSLKKKIGKKIHPDFAKNDAIRRHIFDDFISAHFVSFSKPIRDYEELQKYSTKFSDVLVGSDQLWLPSGLDTNFYNLMFVPDNINKIAYSASFGVSKIPSYQKIKTKTFLERINHISVREQAGADIIKELTGREAKVILDPTMIVDRKAWDKNILDQRIVEEKYIFCYFLGNNPSQRDEVKKLAEKKDLTIVVLKHLDEYIPSDEKFGDISLYDVGPNEFVNLIRHAEYICTDSFHGSVFSIIYHKQFISFNRYSKGKNSRNSRLDTLFSNIGISRRFDGNIIHEIDKEIDWELVEERLENFRRDSLQFINTALKIEEEKENEGKSIIQDFFICKESECTGCSVCASVCPRNAIIISKNANGFYIPKINNAMCIKCNSCIKICPTNNQPTLNGPTKAYAYQNSDEIRFNSTSGGFFNAIACKIIDEGGVVCGAAFDKDMILRHTIVEKKEDLEPLQKSKYVQSATTGIYQKIKEYLNEGKTVLFVGVGCQAAALRNYIGINERLIIIDLVCYGVPSSGLFEDWIKYIEKKYNNLVVDVRFRDKSYGYATPNVKILFENGKSIECCRDSNIYTNLFFRHLSIRTSCYSCRFKTIDRASDLTLGDLWLINKYDPTKDDNKGTTCVFAHTKKGLDICNQLCMFEIDNQDIINEDAGKLVECVVPARGTNSFWKKYKEDGFDSLINIYEKKSLKVSIKYFVKKIMNLFGISKVWYKKSKKSKLMK